MTVPRNTVSTGMSRVLMIRLCFVYVKSFTLIFHLLCRLCSLGTYRGLPVESAPVTAIPFRRIVQASWLSFCRYPPPLLTTLYFTSPNLPCFTKGEGMV